MKKVDRKILKKIYKPRPKTARKYDAGLLLVIGGSEFYSGPPAFSALAAFRSGVDMVNVVAPERAANIIASFAPDLAAYPLPGKHLVKKHLNTLLSLSKSAHAVAGDKAAMVIGGGTGRSKETQETILEYLEEVSLPGVIDADGIHAVSKDTKSIYKKPLLITPHSHEFYVLTGKEVEGFSVKEKANIVREQALKLKTTILLKGDTDLISDGEEVYFSKVGSSSMTVGGTGDILAGIAGALLAKGVSPLEAGQAAALINGLSGQLGEKAFGESLMSSDLLDIIPQVIK